MRGHAHTRHAFAFLNPRLREGLTVAGRRCALKAGLAGVSALTLPRLLAARETATAGAEGTTARPGSSATSRSAGSSTRSW
jgi:hypothetical protein